jgi:hypothetical protein
MCRLCVSIHTRVCTVEVLTAFSSGVQNWNMLLGEGAGDITTLHTDAIQMVSTDDIHKYIDSTYMCMLYYSQLPFFRRKLQCSCYSVSEDSQLSHTYICCCEDSAAVAVRDSVMQRFISSEADAYLASRKLLQLFTCVTVLAASAGGGGSSSTSSANSACAALAALLLLL